MNKYHEKNVSSNSRQNCRIVHKTKLEEEKKKDLVRMEEG